MHRRALLCCCIAVGLQLPSLAHASEAEPAAVRIGAVASSPASVTIFQSITKYLGRNGLPADYVLYSNYDALVAALDQGDVDIAWNTPLAHAQYHVKHNCSQTLVMRDVDRDVRSVLLVRLDAGIDNLEQLAGKRLILGSREAAEATVLPLHYLRKAGLNQEDLEIVSLDQEVDFRGNPCSSPEHVLAALFDGRGEAGIVTENLWRDLQQSNRTPQVKAIWTSPAFSHCVFTAAADFDKERGAKFTELMTAMSATAPETAEAMRLEGTQKWLPGTPEGFADLTEALRNAE